MNKQKLIKQINQAFKNVKLEDGIGLWEGQGRDDYLSPEECRKLRERDEKEDWSKILVLNLYKCSSSLSFFDAKGMRFHLPQFMLFHIGFFEKEEEELHKKGKLEHIMCPDIFWSISHKMESDYFQNIFSLLNKQQTKCVISFLNYLLEERKENYKITKPSFNLEEDLKEIKETIAFWKTKLK